MNLTKTEPSSNRDLAIIGAKYSAFKAMLALKEYLNLTGPDIELEKPLALISEAHRMLKGLAK